MKVIYAAFPLNFFALAALAATAFALAALAEAKGNCDTYSDWRAGKNCLYWSAWNFDTVVDKLVCLVEPAMSWDPRSQALMLLRGPILCEEVAR